MSLARPIPLDEAAAFFAKIKHADWSEPPDLSGALEGQFSAPLEQALQLITTAIAAKFRMVVAYYTFAESLRDVAQHGVGEVFHEHAGQELEAAEYYLKRAAVLGGAIHLEPIEPPPASTDPVHIVQTMMRAEQEAIALQRQLHQMLGTENPMRIEVERILTEDQHHLDELWQMLPSELHEAGQAAMAEGAAATSPTSPEAAPAAPPASPQSPGAGAAGESAGPPDVKEAAARMRFSLGLQKLGFGMPIDQYLANEAEGMEAQRQNEAEFYRGQAQSAQQQGMATQQQLADAQQQLQQLQEQQAQVAQTIQAANDEALAASDESLRQTQLAANMRLGYQKLRQQIIELASQDPEQVGTLPGDVPAGAGAGMMPGAGAGQPESEGMGPGQPAAAPGASQPGEIPAGSGGAGREGPAGTSANGSGKSGNTPSGSDAASTTIKIGAFGSALSQHLGAVAGGVAGGVAGAKKALGAGQQLQERSQRLDQAAQGDGSFGNALEIAKARAGVAEAESAQQHPIRTALLGGLRGAAMGAALGEGTQRLHQNIGNVMGALRA